MSAVNRVPRHPALQEVCVWLGLRKEGSRRRTVKMNDRATKGAIMWETAAFRPQMDPGFTYRIHDLASIMFIALPWTGMLQAIVLALAIFQDPHGHPVFPRWLAYASLWAALCFLPGGLNCLAKTGVIAWNGLLAWWLGLAIFGGWIFAVSICLVRYAIPHQQAEQAKVGV